MGYKSEIFIYVWLALVLVLVSLEIYKKDLSEYKNIIVKCENSINESKNKLINFYKNHS